MGDPNPRGKGFQGSLWSEQVLSHVGIEFDHAAQQESAKGIFYQNATDDVTLPRARAWTICLPHVHALAGITGSPGRQAVLLSGTATGPAWGAGRSGPGVSPRRARSRCVAATGPTPRDQRPVVEPLPAVGPVILGPRPRLGRGREGKKRRFPPFLVVVRGGQGSHGGAKDLFLAVEGCCARREGPF